MPKRDYKYNIGDTVSVNNNREILVLNRYTVKNINNHNKKWYDFKCLNCGYEHKASENNISNGKGCPVCCKAPRIVESGINSIADTSPELVNLLFNPDDAYNYTKGSDKEIYWKCPFCGNKILKSPSVVSAVGLRCKKCSDGISYPEKFVFNVLTQIGVEFVTQLSKKNLAWCGKYKYDFYIPKLNCIIEVNGDQHYNSSFESCGGKCIEDEIKNDVVKKELAFKNGIVQYIELDCRYSDLGWIKANIESSLLPILDVSSEFINWEECHKYACSSLIRESADLFNKGLSVLQVAGKINRDNSSVRKYLKQATDCNLCNYDSELTVQNNGKTLGQYSKLHNSKKVICLTTNILYDSVTEAAKSINVKNCCISDCCGGRQKTSGGYKWKYFEDFIKSTQAEDLSV